MKITCFLLCALIVLVLLPTLFLRTDRTDLHILMLAAHRLEAGEPVYRLTDANEHTKPPLATLAFAPFAALPLPWLAHAWDFANLIAFPLLLFCLGVPRFAGLVALFVLLNPWNAEIRFGQYNVLFLLALVASVCCRRWGLLGAALVLGILFKPTSVFFLPWALRESSRKTVTLAVGAAAILVLATTYGMLFGCDGLWRDTREWLAFLPRSSAKHLLRHDNYGLPSLLAFFGWSDASGPVLALGFGFSVLACFVLDPMVRLATVAALCVVCSPMAWLQNYTLLLPAVVWALGRVVNRGPSWKLVSAAIFVFWLGVGALNPTTCQWLECGSWGLPRPPLLGVLGGAVLLFAIGAVRFCAPQAPGE